MSLERSGNSATPFQRLENHFNSIKDNEGVSGTISFKDKTKITIDINRPSHASPAESYTFGYEKYVGTAIIHKGEKNQREVPVYKNEFDFSIRRNGLVTIIIPEKKEKLQIGKIVLERDAISPKNIFKCEGDVALEVAETLLGWVDHVKEGKKHLPSPFSLI